MTQTRAGDAAFVETTAAGDLPRFEAEWRDLMDRCAEPNVFADADFLLPALARLAPRRAATILVWSDAGRRRLIGLAAIEPPRSPLGLARIWRSEQAALAALLIDRAAPVEALGAILAWTAARAVGLRLPALESGGPVARALAEVAANGSLALEIHARRQRAALPSGPGEEFEAAIDKKRRKEWARQRRRLAEHGRLESSLLDPVVGVETFLTLEGRGWKGARRTALALNAARAAFARDMLARFAARGALRIDALTLDGEAIAVGLTLRCRERGFYWKTAYDERFTDASPGLLLTLDLSRRLEREPGLRLVDSCAAPNHPMIDRLWRGRLELADFAIAVRPEAAGRFALALRAAKLAEYFRERLKRAANRLLRRKAS